MDLWGADWTTMRTGLFALRDQLVGWAATQGAEVHQFPIDPAATEGGAARRSLTSDDCGTTCYYLLLDEFYRTAIWLGGHTVVVAGAQ